MAFGIDSGVLEAATRGEPAALRTLIAQISPHIERQLLRYPVAEEDRRDLLQATLMQVMRRLGSFRGDSSFSTWLFRVTANEALMLMRSQRRLRARLEDVEYEALAALPETGPRADVTLEDREQAERVQTALEELPDDYRSVVALHYHLDLGLQEIADRLSLSESAVRSRLHRARSRLRTLLVAA
jgi:RNA polymerase sigma-70 factor (ECF subfamily)